MRLALPCALFAALAGCGLRTNAQRGEASDSDGLTPRADGDGDSSDSDWGRPTSGGSGGVGAIGGGTDTGGRGGAGATGGGGDASMHGSEERIPCAIEQIVRARCQPCHGELLIGGTPMRLVDLADFTQDYTVRTTPQLAGRQMPMYELAAIRIAQKMGTGPMPQGQQLTTDEYNALLDWLGQGAPSGVGCRAEGGTGATGGSGGVGGGPPEPPGPCRTDQPLIARENETCYEFASHAPGGSDAFEISSGESYARFYFAVPWPNDAVATRYGADFDDIELLLSWRLFDSGSPLPAAEVTASSSPTVLSEEARLLGAWTVGGCNMEFPAEMGLELPAPGGKLMIEWRYYHSGESIRSDASKVQICTVPADTRPNVGSITWLGTENLNADGVSSGIPPGQEGVFAGTCLNRTDQPITLVMLWPSMRELGTHMRSELIRLDGSVEVIFDSPFNARYQSHRDLERVALRPTERIRTTCSYFNHTAQAVGFGTSDAAETCYQLAFAYPAGALDKPDNVSAIGATHTCWGDEL